MDDDKSPESRRLLPRRNLEHEKVSVPVYAAIMLFAISSWITVNGLFVEVPLFIDHLPEGWNFPSYMILVIQLANFGIVAWLLIQRLCKPSEVITIYVLLIIAVVATALIGFFWDTTVTVGDKQWSIPLLALTAVSALVDCLSSVIFLPFVARFHLAAYVAAYYAGGWMGGILSGIVGLLQGVGSDPVCVNSTRNASVFHNETFPVYPPPLFPVGAFVSVLCALLALSAASFTALICGGSCRQEMERNFATIEVTADDQYNYRPDHASPRGANTNEQIFVGDLVNRSHSDDGISDTRIHVQLNFFGFLVLIYVVNCLANGVLPSLQPFSCLPYGRVVFTLSVRLSAVTGPVACFIATRYSLSSLFRMTLLTLLGTVSTVYLMYLAFLSPNVVLKDHLAGKILVVLTAVLSSAVFAYVRVSAAVRLRISDGASGLMCCGIATQAGSFSGAVVSFIIVDVLKLLVSSPVC